MPTPQKKRKNTQKFVPPDTSVSFSSEAVANVRNHPKPWEAYFIKTSTSGEPPVRSTTHQNSIWGHS